MIIIASNSLEIVDISWALWKFFLRMSNVFDGATQVRNVSKPKAKTNDRRAGAATIRCTTDHWMVSLLVHSRRVLKAYFIVMRENTMTIVWKN